MGGYSYSCVLRFIVYRISCYGWSVAAMSNERAELIAITWFDGKYDRDDAVRSACIQGVDFRLVEQYYGELYHVTEAASNGY